MIELYNVKLGSGPRVIFVHGDGPSQGEKSRLQDNAA